MTRSSFRFGSEQLSVSVCPVMERLSFSYNTLWWIQQAWKRALIVRAHDRNELIWSIGMKALHTAVRMSPYKRVNSDHCVSGHGLNIAPGGTSRDKNRKNLDNYSESTEQWNILGKLRIRPIFFGIFPTPDKVMCYRSKNHRAFFFYPYHA